MYNFVNLNHEGRICANTTESYDFGRFGNPLKFYYRTIREDEGFTLTYKAYASFDRKEPAPKFTPAPPAENPLKDTSAPQILGN
ncbi:hypothetical protein L596_011628 [Steinernema carpocapsae]|uniref:Uncharacterized protein n=1 Tax=Steinernema carpocapsae TaxID=34508 RepID=A0A4U5NVD7_STECR|nr:hypothetical protein L596_011628 [Steinernema carpocapsae]